MKTIVTTLVAALLLSACASHRATFVSVPAGASVFVNGEEIGTTPCTFCYKEGSETDYNIRVERGGYQAIEQQLTTDEVDAAARSKWMAAGAVWSPLWVGALFTHKLKESYEFVLRENPLERTARR
jgi:PEGA domain